MARVFVTQVPHKRDGDTKSFVPTINIAPAAEHGDVVVMMPPQASFYATGDMVAQLKEKLNGYDYDEGDSLLATGSPLIIAAAAAILGERFGKFNMLSWDKNLGRYIKTRIVL